MNTAPLKKYGPQARRDFLSGVSDRAAKIGLHRNGQHDPIEVRGDFAIMGGRSYPKVFASQRKKLEDKISKTSFDGVLESAAYTWFNRFMAIRYMEVQGFLDHGFRVFSHPEGKPMPEILEQAQNVTLPGLNREEVVELKLDGSRDEQLYRLLLLGQCRSLNQAMPFLFESIDDATELLLPDNLLATNSLVRKLARDIDDDQWQRIEIVGWLYQFYISEEKARVDAELSSKGFKGVKKSAVSPEDIPAKTQLFTPKWIVDYLLHNSLGRYWLEVSPSSSLKDRMEFFVDPASQEPHVEIQLAQLCEQSRRNHVSPETITLFDPCMGSGHILVQAYELFKEIYEERGYSRKAIPTLILENNLFGLEIDDRAAQIAGFALMMKARADDRQIFSNPPKLSVMAVSKGLEVDLRSALSALTHSILPKDGLDSAKVESDKHQTPIYDAVVALYDLFRDADSIGSLIRLPLNVSSYLDEIERAIQSAEQNLVTASALESLIHLMDQARLLCSRYDIVVTNPPYLTNNLFSASLKRFALKQHQLKRTDLYALFQHRALDSVKAGGYVALVTRNSWMFLGSFVDVRQRVLHNATLEVLANLGGGAFEELGGEVLQVCMFAIRATVIPDYVSRNAVAIELSGEEKRSLVKPECHRFLITANDYSAIPDEPLVFWVGTTVRAAFRNNPKLGDVANLREGIHTGNNERFLRYWWEIESSLFSSEEDSENSIDSNGKRWIPYNKGGEFRKWFGNNLYVIRFDLAARTEMSSLQGHVRPSQSLYFLPGGTWTDVGSGSFGVRFYPKGFLFDGKGMVVVSDDVKYLLALMNSKPFQFLADLIMPTLNYKCGNVKKLPYVDIQHRRAGICDAASSLIEIARRDWDSSEESWSFTRLALLNTKSPSVSAAFKDVQAVSESDRVNWSRQEESLNNIFIREYGLQESLTPKVEDRQITLRSCSDHKLAMGLVSYFVGILQGRWDYAELNFKANGITPVMESDWLLAEDAVNLFAKFVRVTWPEVTETGVSLDSNLRCISAALGYSVELSPLDSIRRYLATQFYKDHLQAYRKRPIYWLFSSGTERAFQALIYLHHYNDGTLSRMRMDYVVPLQQRMSARLEQLEGDIEASATTSDRKRREKEREKLKKQIAELRIYDEKLRHYADQRIELDLDDGVKVNYAKFGDLLAESKAITGEKDE